MGLLDHFRNCGTVGPAVPQTGRAYILRGFSHNQESTTCGGVERKLGKESVQNVCATDKDVAKPEKGSQIIHMATWDGSCVSKQSVTCLCQGTDLQHEGFRQTQSSNIS